ncbi:MAG: protein kinase [Anaerolineaceae bacterium]|nr:protein kinase [Anaerolineaceae bacterium]
MSSKVILTITKGENEGKTYEFSEVSRAVIGRQEDCAIVVPEKTVSRYHCLLEITPPKVVLQDFGSLNGTFLNGEKIGQRDRDQSLEEAQKEAHDSFEMKDGDVLGLGRQCEISLKVETSENCARCGAELPVLPPHSKGLVWTNDEGQRICEKCWKAVQKEKEEEERRRKEEEKKRLDEEKRRKEEELKLQQQAQKTKQKKCKNCGKLFTPAAPDNALCPKCLAEEAEILNAALAGIILKNNQPAQKPEKPSGPSIIPGYDNVKKLGEGGMGTVWKVRNRKTGKDFALKTILPKVGMDENARKLFMREADICKCLDHKNVVKGYETGDANGTLYILMDLCEGGSVDDLIEQKGGKLSIELATWIMLQVLSGLDYVHNMDIDVLVKAGLFRGMKEVNTIGVVHRDFKPGNVFLSDTSDHPVAKVADFGLAKAFNTAGKSQVSKTGSIKGTPVFMPKQQAMNCKYAKPEVDVWAAAASFYYMLTGKFPKDFYSGKNPWQVIILEKAIPIRKRNSAIPEKMAAVIDKALVEDPSIGYKSAAALRRDLVAALPSNVREYCKGIL